MYRILFVSPLQPPVSNKIFSIAFVLRNIVVTDLSVAKNVATNIGTIIEKNRRAHKLKSTEDARRLKTVPYCSRVI